MLKIVIKIPKGKRFKWELMEEARKSFSEGREMSDSLLKKLIKSACVNMVSVNPEEGKGEIQLQVNKKIKV